MKKLLVVVFMLLAPGITYLGQAQEKYKIEEKDYQNSSVEMADSFRAEGKIYVVVAVMVTLLGCLLFYVVRMDRKVTRLEKEVEAFLEKGK